MNKNQKFLENKKKFKHGTISVVLTVFVVAVIVIVNVIFSALAYKKNWYIDLTKEKLYDLSDAGREMLNEVDGDIAIHFCAPFDKLESDYYMKMVFELVKQMADEYDNISYDYIDIIKNPSLANKYKSSTTDRISTSNIIVESGTEFRNFTLQALFTFDTEDSTVPWAFNGEKKLITAMTQITQAETPIAYFTYTHGESLSYTMQEMFYDAGYELRTIDLVNEEIDEDARLIVISDPKYDFEGISEDTAGRKSEIEKIDDFLDGFGNVMIFRDPDTGELPELDEFLVEWGIEFDNSVLKDPMHSIDTTHYSLEGNYAIDESIGASLVSDIVSVGTVPKTIVRYASPINLLYDYKDSRQTSVALYSYDTAERYVDGKLTGTGEYPLVALSRELRYIDNTPHYSYVFAVGSKYFTYDNYLDQKYGNQDIIYTMMRAMGKVQIPSDLKFKVFEDESLVITTADAGTWTGVLTFALPAIIFVLGIVIWIRRKHA